ncbi:hypothetical protein F8237_06970 [Bradyrhizobium betae]|uniref:Uncharacterized protein n=1 Tax=Bradyrhizobium betae TaxID=244734 RepID=A0A5P6P1H3_9BRAD|nr:hypothetical protein F8237_06970 [Bradyrhizobium betae]
MIASESRHLVVMGGGRLGKVARSRVPDALQRVALLRCVRGTRAERARTLSSSSLRAQRSNPDSLRGGLLDCFAALAMTECEAAY